METRKDIRDRDNGVCAPLRLHSEAFIVAAMDRFGDAVYRTALSKTGSATDAEDVFQDVFLRLVKDETQFTDAEHVKAWLLRVTINRCRDLARLGWHRTRAALDSESLEAIPDSASESVHDQAFGSSKHDDLMRAVASLPDHLREVTHLFYAEDCSTEEIARIVGCAPATVRTRLHRARSALRQLLESAPDDEPGPARTFDMRACRITGDSAKRCSPSPGAAVKRTSPASHPL